MERKHQLGCNDTGNVLFLERDGGLRVIHFTITTHHLTCALCTFSVYHFIIQLLQFKKYKFKM